MTNKNILVTGGAGFIGSNLVKELINQGNNVTILDDFSVGKMKNIEDLFINNEDLHIVTGSVCDINLVRDLMYETDIVFHLAIQCLVKCNEDPVLAHKVIDEGTFNICIAAHEYKTKIVYISSSEVYGTCKVSPMSESHPTEPQSIYGLTKLIGEEYIRFFNKYYNVPAVIIRPFNAYGPNHRNDQYAAVITNFVRRLEDGKYPIIEWTGEQSRDFTYVSDTVNGIILLSKLEHGEIVNIGNGESITIKKLANTLLRIYGKDNDLNNLIFTEQRNNDVFKLEADIQLAKSYGYEPKVSIEKGLRKYISWWRNQ